MTSEYTNRRLRRMASMTSLVVAFFLVGVKGWAWLETGSIAMLTSAADGLVDVVASLVTFIGVRYSERPADPGHRFGHGKAEAVAAFVQALLLAGVALALGVESVRHLITPEPLLATALGIGVIILSSIVAAGLVSMQTYVVKHTGSTAIAADRAHYVTDFAVNLAVLCALVLERTLGWNWADAAGALLIAAYMLWNARGMAVHALDQLLDRELDAACRKRIKAAILACDGALGVHDLRTRHGGDRMFVEFHVEVAGDISVHDGHEIGDRAEASVRALFTAADVLAHIEPAGIDDKRLDHDLVAVTSATGRK